MTKSAAHLFLCDDLGRILMCRRFNTGYEDGNFSVVAGHIEDGESATQAMRREAKEEVGIDVAALEFVHVMHRSCEDGIRVDFFFRTVHWSGTVLNAEPHKCDRLRWCRADQLPTNTVPYVRAAIGHVGAGLCFSEFGWRSL